MLESVALEETDDEAIDLRPAPGGGINRRGNKDSQLK